MTKQSALNSLDTVIGKLSHLNCNIEGNLLENAIKQVAYVRGKLIMSHTKVKQLK